MTEQRPLGFWLKLLDRMIDERFASTLEEHGVTRRQWQLLSVLSTGGATVEQLDVAIAPFLAAPNPRADIEPESSVEHLSELIESGWVDATPAGYEVTERGSVAYRRLADVVAANREIATEGLTTGEYSAMIDTMERIARNLGWADN
ncbi:MarR family winged helix-turn-helix transcriptional regulator [Glaciihabitans sp. dw_435]|uniref:MarR family winged helix-turn-helix transcriptional regulator n=1 Tax=Glaciihabitans sp. dw_435 TaxID=2720081 RepID=UPI001BD48BC5|nr:MarR family transcriptional regulator [Glaciihabitans sp. dw_435]